MQEVIASILDAEKKAEEILKNATEKAKTIRQTADENGEKIKNGAIAVFKLHRASALKTAETDANGEYDAILKAGENDAEEISKTSVNKIDEYADEIVKGITGWNVNSQNVENKTYGNKFS